MKTPHIKTLGPMLAAALCALAPSAFAASTWQFGSGSAVGTCTASTVAAGNCAALAGSDLNAPQITAAAYSTTASGSTFALATLGNYTGGLGVSTDPGDTGTPNHAVDNFGYTDLIAFSFGGKQTELTTIKTGWAQNDSDISLLRWAGASAPNLATDLKTQTVSTLLSTGWALVGNYMGSNSGGTYAVNTGKATSSWWLISAYNTYGSASCSAGSSSSGVCGTGASDYFKVLSIAANISNPPGQVPEPGSFALLGMGLLGLMTLGRRTEKTA